MPRTAGKNVVLGMLLCLCATIAASTSQSTPPRTLIFNGQFEAIQISSFCHFVYKRFYFIERLKRSVGLLKEAFVQQHILPSTLQQTLDELESLHILHHPQLATCLSEIKQKYNFKDLFILWEALQAYSAITDPNIMEEFAKLVLYIYKSFLIELLAKTPETFYVTRILNNQALIANSSLGKLLDLIDIAAQQYRNSIHPDPFSLSLPEPILTTKDDDPPLTVITEHVVERFYCNNRLNKPMELLDKLEKKFFSILTKPHRGGLYTFSYPFQHQHMQICVNKIEETQSIKPLLRTWECVKEYKHIDNATFIKEFIIAAIYIYQQVAKLLFPQTSKPTFSETAIAAIYENVDTLPIFELLDAIDHLADLCAELYPVQLSSGKESWSEWLRRQWWMPPLIAGAIAYTIISNQTTVQNHS